MCSAFCPCHSFLDQWHTHNPPAAGHGPDGRVCQRVVVANAEDMPRSFKAQARMQAHHRALLRTAALDAAHVTNEDLSAEVCARWRSAFREKLLENIDKLRTATATLLVSGSLTAAAQAIGLKDKHELLVFVVNCELYGDMRVQAEEFWQLWRAAESEHRRRRAAEIAAELKSNPPPGAPGSCFSIVNIPAPDLGAVSPLENKNGRLD
jgi:hypothetical protein